ncbi:hypothetical protein AOLI_G00232450 [Acnodon oligacanthus]
MSGWFYKYTPPAWCSPAPLCSGGFVVLQQPYWGKLVPLRRGWPPQERRASFKWCSGGSAASLHPDLCLQAGIYERQGSKDEGRQRCKQRLRDRVRMQSLATRCQCSLYRQREAGIIQSGL